MPLLQIPHRHMPGHFLLSCVVSACVVHCSTRIECSTAQACWNRIGLPAAAHPLGRFREHCDADVRLFHTLLSFDTGYRPSLPSAIGTVAAISDYPHLWAYARDLFATPGFVDDAEKTAVGLLPHADGRYRHGFGAERYDAGDEGPRALARWQQPHGRDGLSGSPLTSGPGGAGSEDYWSWLQRPARA